MANNGTTITAPVQVTDVMAVLGESASDVVSLCHSSKINNKARFKPYNFGGIIGSAEPNWEQTIKAQNFGMTPSYFTPQTNGASYTNPTTTAKDAFWRQWQLPQGGETAPSRLADFNRYNKSAVGCIDKLEIQGLYTVSGQKTPCFTIGSDSRRTPISALLHLNPYADIPLGDFHEWNNRGDFANYYLTIIVGANVSGLGNGILVAQSEMSIGNSGSLAIASLDTHIDESVASDLRTNSSNVILAVTIMPKINACSGGKTAWFTSVGDIGYTQFLSLQVYPETTVDQVLYATAKFTDTDSGSFPVAQPVQVYKIKTTFDNLQGHNVFAVDYNEWEGKIEFRSTGNAFRIAEFSAQNLPFETIDLEVRVKFLQGSSSYNFDNGADLIFNWAEWRITGNALYAADNWEVQPMTFSRDEVGLSGVYGDVDVWVEIRIAQKQPNVNTRYEFTTADNGGTQAKTPALKQGTINLK